MDKTGRGTPSETSSVNRRDLLRATGALAGGAMCCTGSKLVLAEEGQSFEDLVPADKRLSDIWLRSLFERGEPNVYRGEELPYIGMPIGGIACGQLYLGGDGRLWHWNIFQPAYQSAYGSMSMGIHYATPPRSDDPQQHPLQHGFALRTRQAAADQRPHAGPRRV